MSEYDCCMLDYSHKSAIDALKIPRRVIMATNGPAGLLASEFFCESADMKLYVLVPKTSDHLFNLENDNSVSLVTDAWELKGQAQILSETPADLHLNIFIEPNSEWCTLVRIAPRQIHFLRNKGWGNLESIDLT